MVWPSSDSSTWIMRAQTPRGLKSSLVMVMPLTIGLSAGKVCHTHMCSLGMRHPRPAPRQHLCPLRNCLWMSAFYVNQTADIHRQSPCGTAVAHAAPQSPCDAGYLARSARTAVAAQKKGEPKGPPFLGAQSQPVESQPAEITRRPRTGTAWSSRPARRPAGRRQDSAWSNPRGCRPRPPRHQPGGSRRR